MPGLSRGVDPPAARDTLLAWRIARLRASGFDRQLAEDITRDGRYDLHALLELVDRGCPSELAAQIRAPLESPGGSRC